MPQIRILTELNKKVIRATNMIQILLQFKRMIFRPQFGWFGFFHITNEPDYADNRSNIGFRRNGWHL